MGTVFSAEAGPLEEITDGYGAEILGANDLMSIGHNYFEPGATAVEHSHPNQQVGFFYRGEVTFYIDGDPFQLSPGDGYVVWGNEPHYAENPGDEPAEGIFVLSPPRESPSWQD